MKTLLVSIHKEWLDKIISGEKKFEFRENNFINVNPGDKFLLIESKGKKKKRLRNSNIDCANCNMLGGSQCDECKYYVGYEGSGLIRASFVVGEVYDDIDKLNEDLFNAMLQYIGGFPGEATAWNYEKEQERHYEVLQNMGYDSQELAFEITQLKVYETPRDKSELIVESKYLKSINKKCKSLCDWNYMESDHCLECSERIDSIEENKVKRSPQSFMYVIDSITT